MSFIIKSLIYFFEIWRAYKEYLKYLIQITKQTKSYERV